MAGSLNSTTDVHIDHHRLNTASARALCDDPSLSIEPLETTSAVRLGLLPPPAGTLNASNGRALSRSISDAMAMVATHHNETLHKRLQPRGKVALSLFNEMERARCEALGARRYAGLESNLASLWQRTHALVNLRSSNTIEQLRVAFGCLAREALRIKVTPTDPMQALVTHWREASLNNLASLWQKMPDVATDQTRFAALALDIINAIDISNLNSDDADELSTEPAPADQAQDDEDNEGDGGDDTNDTSEEDTDTSLTVELRDEPDQSGEALVADLDDSDIDDINQANRDAPVNADADNTGASTRAAGTGYQVFSTAQDEIITAKTLCSDAELDILRRALDEQIERHAKVVGKLSGRLQRVLMAQQQRHWKFDLEEGQLDTSRLTRLVTEPLSALSFKQESDIQFKNTTVTLLVDNSKSMLGKPIAIAAACSDLLAQTLERCGVSVEILGFTTTRLHGGELVEQWQKNGADANPGRLNGLRHIIYKPADTPYRRARKGFGLMLMKDLLKQNIDGEALLWAHDRLLRRAEQRKILMIISDGAPIDTSTMSANQPDYLVDHLHHVIGTIEKRNAVELLAIGIGHDVSQYYRRAMTIYDARDLGKSMLAQLSNLFKQAN